MEGSVITHGKEMNPMEHIEDFSHIMHRYTYHSKTSPLVVRTCRADPVKTIKANEFQSTNGGGKEMKDKTTKTIMLRVNHFNIMLCGCRQVFRIPL